MFTDSKISTVAIDKSDVDSRPSRCDDDGFVIVLDYDDAAARGYVAGSSSLLSFGERTTSGAETNTPVCGWATFAIPSAAGVQMSIVSTSANDASAGSGIRTVELHYLDASLNPLKETITLNGLTPVLTVATNIRFIQSLHVMSYGSSQYAAGTITATNGGVTYSQITAGESRCSSSFRMIPKDKKFYIGGATGSSISGSAAARSLIKLVASRIDVNQFTSPLILMPYASVGVQDSALAFNFPPMQPFLEGDVVGFVHTTDKAATVTAAFYGRLENA